jgi:hypothetical protein
MNGVGLIKVLADDLEKNQFSSLVELFESASIEEFTRRGKRIVISGPTRKRVKFLLGKFLHANHLSEYRVLDHGDALEIVHVKPEPKRRMTKPGGLKSPVPYGPQLPYLSGVVKPVLAVKWQGKPPSKRARSTK